MGPRTFMGVELSTIVLCPPLRGQTNSNNVRKNAFSLNLRRLGLERGTVHVNNEEFDDG